MKEQDLAELLIDLLERIAEALERIAAQQEADSASGADNKIKK